MKLFTVGCSFTYSQERGWPYMLSKKIKDKHGIEVELVNNGMPGAGNTYIANQIPLDSGYRRSPDLAIVMWSGLTRKDILIDRTNTDVVNALDGYGYVRWASAKTDYVLSGGIVGSWMGHPTTQELFGPLYKMSNNRTMAQDTLLNILSLQNYFKQNNITYIMSSYVNYWTSAERVADIDFGIGQYADLRYLVKKIDFDQWAFINDNKDGIYELAKQIDDIQEDGWHPDFIAHEQWADLLLKKLEDDNFFNKL